MFVMELRRIHLISGAVIGLYASLHIANHLVGLKSIDDHIRFMETFRHIYRYPAIEVLLLLAIGVQIVTGINFVVSTWRVRSGTFAWLQVLSGLYLAFFLIVHVGTVFYARVALGLDTNFYFAAAGMHVGHYDWFFVPYYFFAVVALFTHPACAAHGYLSRQGRVRIANSWPVAFIFAGLVCAIAISALLKGYVHPVVIPKDYLVIYGVAR